MLNTNADGNTPLNETLKTISRYDVRTVPGYENSSDAEADALIDTLCRLAGICVESWDENPNC